MRFVYNIGKTGLLNNSIDGQWRAQICHCPGEGYSASSSRLTMSIFKASRRHRAFALVSATCRKCGLTFFVTLSGVASPHSVYVPWGNTATA